jgi:hypothetical protein
VNSLVISTTVWVIHRVHCYTTDVWEEFTTSLGFVVRSSSSSQWHLITAMTCEHTNGGSTAAWKFLNGTGRHSNTDFISKFCFNQAGISCCSSDLATITRSKFDVVDSSPFRDLCQ